MHCSSQAHDACRFFLPLGLATARDLSRNTFAGGRNRTRFRRCQAGEIAIAEALQTCRVVAPVLGFGQCCRFGRSQRRVVAGFETVFAKGQVATVLCDSDRLGLLHSQPRVVAIAPAIAAVGEVTLLFSSGHGACFRRS